MLLLIICIRLLFRGKGSRTVLAVLVTDEGERLPVTAAESAIGRSAACDIQVTAPTVSRRHAVLTRDNEGFRISDIRSKGGLYVNEERVGRGARLELGDTVKLADVRLRLEAAQKEDEPEQKRRRNRREPPALAGPFLLTLFQLLACLSLMLHDMDELPWTLPACFLGLVAMEWICFRLRRFEELGVLLPAFFLSTLGLCVAASAAPRLPAQAIRRPCSGGGLVLDIGAGAAGYRPDHEAAVCGGALRHFAAGRQSALWGEPVWRPQLDQLGLHHHPAV